MDWGVTSYIDEKGHVHKNPAFIMILGSSRSKYVEFTKRCDLYSLLRCIVNAFAYYGGVPKIVLIDRRKTVTDGSKAGKPIWNSRFADFAAYGFCVEGMPGKKAQTKGKVERLADDVKDHFLPEGPFTDLYDLNST